MDFSIRKVYTLRVDIGESIFEQIRVDVVLGSLNGHYRPISRGDDKYDKVIFELAKLNVCGWDKWGRLVKLANFDQFCMEYDKKTREAWV